MNDSGEVEDWVDRIIDKLTPYEVVLEDLVLSGLVILTLIIILTAFSMIGNISMMESVGAKQAVEEMFTRYPKLGLFGRLSYAGEILYPFVVMLALMILAREAWNLRREKQISKGEKEINHFFREFTEKLSNFEIVVNRLLIIFLGLMTSIAAVFAFYMMAIQSPDKILFWIVEPSRIAAESVYNWITMLALIILAREGWLIMKKRRR